MVLTLYQHIAGLLIRPLKILRNYSNTNYTFTFNWDTFYHLLSIILLIFRCHNLIFILHHWYEGDLSVGAKFIYFGFKLVLLYLGYLVYSNWLQKVFISPNTYPNIATTIVQQMTNIFFKLQFIIIV